MAGKERPRAWLPLDVDYLAQDSIRDLGETFGPAGPMVFLVILTEAKRHALSGIPVNKQGTVDLRYRAVARSAFLKEDASTVGEVVEACVGLGLLEHVGELDRTRLHVRLLKWKRWEASDSGAAQRKARSRSSAFDGHNADDDPIAL